MNQKPCPVVRAAIEKLAKSTNSVSGITHPVDRSRAIDLFYALLDLGYRFDFPAIYKQLVGYGWESERATEVWALAELVSLYGDINPEFPTTWGRLAVQRIIEANTLSEMSSSTPTTAQQE